MRLIALLSIYNRGDFKRIKEYLKEQSAFRPEDSVSLIERISKLRILQKRYGRLRFLQIAALSELNVIAILETEKEQTSLITQMSVETDYPHLLTQWQLDPIDTESIEYSTSRD